MRRPYNRRRKAKRATLRGSRLLEFHRGRGAARKTACVEGVDVMQTARRARPSIGQRFDHQISLLDDILEQGFWCGFCVRRLFKADCFDASGLNMRLQRVHELVGPLFGNREQGYRFANQAFRRRAAFP